MVSVIVSAGIGHAICRLATCRCFPSSAGLLLIYRFIGKSHRVHLKFLTCDRFFSEWGRVSWRGSGAFRSFVPPGRRFNASTETLKKPVLHF